MNWESVLSVFLSGLFGVMISNWYHQKNRIRQVKFQTLRQLMGNRYNIRGPLFTEALNQIFVIFYDSHEVLVALKAFHETITGAKQETTDPANQKLLELFRALCKHLKINPDPLTDSFFLKPFNCKQ